jgi:hypothetical protein
MKDLDDDDTFGVKFINPVSTSNVTLDSDLYSQAHKLKENYNIINSQIIQLEATLGDIKDEISTVEKLVTKLNSFHSDFDEITSNIVEKFSSIHNFTSLNERLGSLRHERDCMLKVINVFCKGERSLCALCFEREFSLFYIPCGHTACTECTAKIRNGSCPFCRADIHRKNSIFIE